MRVRYAADGQFSMAIGDSPLFNMDPERLTVCSQVARKRISTLYFQEVLATVKCIL